MHQVPREDQLELADAIAAGARRRPQAFGTYFSEDGGSCALGAAYEGAYWLPNDVPSVRPRLDRLFDCLENVRRRCPGRLQEAAAAQRDHSAPERRSPLDARADRRVAQDAISFARNSLTSSSTSKG